MKLKVLLLAIAIGVLGCKNDSQNNVGNNSVATKVAADYDNLALTLSIEEGPLKGIYHLKKDKKEVMSSLFINYFDETIESESQRNSSKLNILGLIAKDSSFLVQYITKSFKGKVEKGTHEARMSTNSSGIQECAKLGIVDIANKQLWNKVYGTNLSCGTTLIEDLSGWKEGSIHNRRAVSGSFTDRYELEFTFDDKPSKKVETNITVQFNVRHRMAKY